MEITEAGYEKIAAIVFTMSATAVALNALLIRAIRKTKIFGKAFGTIMMLRAAVETVCAGISLGFFSTLIYFKYPAPRWVNVAFSTFYMFNLSTAYALHFLISINRLIAVYFPVQYRSIVEVKMKAPVVICGALLFGALATSVTLYSPCTNVRFSPVIYEFMPVGCGSDGISVYILVLIVIWGVCTASALALDVCTLAKVIAHSWKNRDAQSERTNHGRNVRFFLQTFSVNLIVFEGVCATQLWSQSFVSNWNRFFICEFQVLLGFVLNGLIPLVMNKEIRKSLHPFSAASSTRIIAS